MAFAHNLVLRFLVYRAIGCFYEPGCKHSRLEDLATDFFWLPSSLLPDGTLSFIDLETLSYLVSGVWGVAAFWLAWGLASLTLKQGNDV